MRSGLCGADGCQCEVYISDDMSEADEFVYTEEPTRGPFCICGKRAGLEAEVKRLREAIREHRDTLDAQANGALPQLDRDDVDNTLYNRTLGVLG